MADDKPTISVPVDVAKTVKTVGLQQPEHAPRLRANEPSHPVVGGSFENASAVVVQQPLAAQSTTPIQSAPSAVAQSSGMSPPILARPVPFHEQGVAIETMASTATVAPVQWSDTTVLNIPSRRVAPGKISGTVASIFEFGATHEVVVGVRETASIVSKAIEVQPRLVPSVVPSPQRLREAAPGHIAWSSIGPAVEQAQGTSWSGRVDAIAFADDYDGFGTPALYLGTSEGGLWRSVHFEQTPPTWTPLLDQVNDLSGKLISELDRLDLTRVSAIALDARRPRTIYVGGGGTAQPVGVVYGSGMLKSTDAGETWTFLDRSPFPNSFAGGHPSITRIIVDPTAKSDELYVCGGFNKQNSGRGIQKGHLNADGTTSFILYMNGLSPTAEVDDLDYAVIGGKLVLYAGVHDQGQMTTAPGIWTIQPQASNPVWTRMSITLVDVYGKSRPMSQMGLIKLAVDHVDGRPNGAYAAILDESGRLLNVFSIMHQKATETWRPAGQDPVHGVWPSIRDRFTGSLDGNAAFAFGLAPWTPSSPLGVLYLALNHVGGNEIYQSTSRGYSWTSIVSGTNGVTPHGDHRIWGFGGGMVFEGNDGGVWQFNPLPGNLQGAGTWDSLNGSTLQTHLLTGIDVSPVDHNSVLVGAQDNGLILGNHGTWSQINDGDRGFVRFDQNPATNGNFAYFTDTPLPQSFWRSLDGGKTFTLLQGFPPYANVPWQAHFAIHPTNPSHIVLGLDRVMQSVDQGTTFQAVSDILANRSPGSPLAPDNPNIYIRDLVYTDRSIYAACWNDVFFYSNSIGAKWRPMGIALIGSEPLSLAFDYSTNTLYMGATHLTVQRFINGGWEDISGNLPTARLSAVNAIALFTAPTRSDPWVFIATEIGVYYTERPQGSSTCWSLYGTNLPFVKCKDLYLDSATGVLAVATWGRGAWITYLPVANSPT